MSPEQDSPERAWRDGALVLADGSVFEGEVLGFGPGAQPGAQAGAQAGAQHGARPAGGEVVFNTVMTGYQEVLTDPSYAGQVITFTYPHIGNYGVAPDDDESRRPFCRGVVVRELTGQPSNWRAAEDLTGWLLRHRLPAMAGVDTRRLTRQFREHGSMPGVFGPVDGQPGSFSEAALLAAAKAEPATDGRDLVAEVTCAAPYRYGAAPGGAGLGGRAGLDAGLVGGAGLDGGLGGRSGLDGGRRYQVVAYDFGIKRNILRNLSTIADVIVVPAGTPAHEVLAMGPGGSRPDGVFLSNGPGDPAAVKGVTETVQALVGEVPVFGICLGHQVLARALGAKTYKLPFGHHGGNHPVRRISTGAVEITSQNHNYAVEGDSFAHKVRVSHVNLNDGVIEGFECPGLRAFSVQYHPEAGPGPHDARYLFQVFGDLMAGNDLRGAISA